MKQTVFLFPGQGSQYVGMGKDLYQNFTRVKELFEEASDTLKMNMKKLCFEASISVLTETINVQPAVTLINACCFEVLKEEGLAPSACAGHSLGEYSALYAARSLDFAELMTTVKHRGVYMQNSAEKNPGGMLAVIGLEIDKLLDICNEASAIGSVEIANHNSPTQIILSGEKDALEKAAELANNEGAKLTVPLKVSGPWHSKFMIDAKQKMEEILNGAAIKETTIPVIANTTANYESTPSEIRTNLTNQITQPVLWSASMERFINDGHTSFVEVGPKKVLTGLMKKINRDAQVLNMEDTATLKKILGTVHK